MQQKTPVNGTYLIPSTEFLSYITNVPIRCTINAAIHATTHCQITTPMAHFAPSSLLIDAMAATHGVYNRQNTRRLAAQGCDHRTNTSSKQHFQRRYHTFLCHKSCDQCSTDPPVSQTQRSENRCHAHLPLLPEYCLAESYHIQMQSKLCRNQTTIVAMKITVNALCRKSFAFSHRSCPTFFAPGRR